MQLTLRKWNLSIGSGQRLFCILGLMALVFFNDIRRFAM